MARADYNTVSRRAFKYHATIDSLPCTPTRKERLAYDYTDVQVIAKVPPGLIGRENWHFYVARP